MCELLVIGGVVWFVWRISRSSPVSPDTTPPSVPMGHPLWETKWRNDLERQVEERKRLKDMQHGHLFDPCKQVCLFCKTDICDYRDSKWDGQDANIIVCSSIIDGSDKPLTMREIWWNSQLALQDSDSTPDRKS